MASKFAFGALADSYYEWGSLDEKSLSCLEIPSQAVAPEAVRAAEEGQEAKIMA